MKQKLAVLQKDLGNCSRLLAAVAEVAEVADGAALVRVDEP